MKGRFVTLFPPAENAHLIKDVGQVPYFLFSQHGYDASIVCYKNSEEYDHLNGEVNGLKIEFLEQKGKKRFLEKAVLEFLEREAKNIDVLNLYHYARDTFYYGALYKKLNPRGVLYLKMDLWNEQFENGRPKFSKVWWKDLILKRKESQFQNAVDVLSFENREGLALFEGVYPQLKSKCIWMPNGVNDRFLSEHFPSSRSFEKKENIILTVGRIGAPIKDHMTMLRGLAEVDLRDWKVIIAGPIDPDFEKEAKAFMAIHPDLEEKIEFPGQMDDRIKIYELYDRSKIFCLTSKRESFGIAYVEAMYFGNWIIGTDGMSAFDDLSDNGRLGSKFSVGGHEELTKIFQQLIDDGGKLDGACAVISTFTNEHFLWSKITQQLQQKIVSARPKIVR